MILKNLKKYFTFEVMVARCGCGEMLLEGPCSRRLGFRLVGTPARRGCLGSFYGVSGLVRVSNCFYCTQYNV